MAKGVEKEERGGDGLMLETCGRCGVTIGSEEGLHLPPTVTREEGGKEERGKKERGKEERGKGRVLSLRLCPSCSEDLWRWMKRDSEDPDSSAVSDSEGDGPRLRMSEDHVVSEGLISVGDERLEKMGFDLPKHPLLTESRQDAERPTKTSSYDDSRSPRVASTLPEEYRWSGLE